ncbi:MAG: energy transducer TonB [Verrucomicrobia bacterium]|nr:energy transducer TonB [Verrucomicrobiota bacterium]
MAPGAAIPNHEPTQASSMNGAVSTPDPSALPQSDAIVSDLSRLCLPVEENDEARVCTWSATISGFLLFIGTFGFFREPLTFVMQLEREPEPVPVLVETPPPTPTEAEQPPETSDSSDASAEAVPTVTVVAANPTEVAFAVPVVGATMVGPAKMATAPPINNVAVARPQAPPAPKITLFTGEENRSDYPHPSYPLEARKRGMSGNILLVAHVDPAGACTRVEVKQSCGHSFLDSFSADWIRKRWVWPAGSARVFEIPVTFNLNR